MGCEGGRVREGCGRVCKGVCVEGDVGVNRRMGSWEGTYRGGGKGKMGGKKGGIV